VHLAQVLDGRRVGDAVPDGFTILLELLEGINGGASRLAAALKSV